MVKIKTNVKRSITRNPRHSEEKVTNYWIRGESLQHIPVLHEESEKVYLVSRVQSKLSFILLQEINASKSRVNLSHVLLTWFSRQSSINS